MFPLNKKVAEINKSAVLVDSERRKSSFVQVFEKKFGFEILCQFKFASVGQFEKKESGLKFGPSKNFGLR